MFADDGKDAGERFEKDDIIVIALYTSQITVLIICVCMRYFKHRDTGTYSLSVRRPRIYRLKISMHLVILILLTALSIMYAMALPKDSGDVYDTVRLTFTPIQFLAWLISCLMLRFEYRRAIGHAWYMHPVFIMYSALIYLVDLIYVIAYGSNIDEDKKKMMTALAVIDGVVLFFSLLLGMLVITFTEDNHAERRNYFTVDPSMRQGLMTEENEVGRSQSRTSSMLYGSQDGVERPKKRIIITANVS